jgi:y4mF family transcriptional regulator
MWAQSAAEIGRIVATARRHRGLTQNQLAGELGVTQKWLSEIERGKDTAHIGRVLQVLSFLGVRLEVGEAPWKELRKTASRASARTSLDEILTAHSKVTRDRKRSR